MPMKPDTLLGRRDLLTLGTAGFLGLAGGAGLLTGARALWRPGGVALERLLDAGKPEEYLPGLLDARLLAEHWVWVQRLEAGFVAFSARCTHLGCKLQRLPGEERFRCMCHGSLFAGDGEVLRGPAPRSMERLHLQLGPGGELQVDPGRRYLRERGQWDAPGALLRLSGRSA